jgi:hypothetical protein
MTHHHEFTTWLTSATRNLPANVAASTRDELSAHYEDALEFYAEAGMSPAEAHQQAMYDLGAANTVANGLNDVHRGQKIYFWGMLASASILIILIGRIILHEALGLELYSTISNVYLSAADALLITMTAYVLLMMDRMLTWRSGQTGVNRIVRMIVVGLVIAMGCDIIYRSAIADELYAGSLLSSFEAETFPAALLIAGSAMGRALMGIGVIALGRKVWAAAPDLYGLGKVLAICLYAMGGGLASTGIWTHLEWEFPVFLAEVINIFAHLFIWNLMVLLFFRLAYRSPVHPRRFA